MRREAVGTSLDDPTDCAPVYRTRTLSNRALKRPLIIVAAVVAAVVLVVGIVQTQDSTEERPAGVVPSPAEAQRALEGAPAPLAEVHELANALLPIEEFDARLEALRGHPVVVNVWGSWCTPCREEFPIFQRVAVETGKTVAFLGVGRQDSEQGAGGFLRDNPLTYPTYMDFDGTKSSELGAVATPSTIFYTPDGEREYIHQGVYRDDADLLEDIRRYLGA